ncbi:MAG: DNA mismatch repair protein MutL [Patescibacteria group bacterium]|nr:MAG: DNA mismatch repair protein MutL [Patescibacteria group bacterium]
MSKIQILDKKVADKIAAGEVIDRPDSVVKELLENSIDAGSTAIEIIIDKAGKKRIEIVDNGEGIESDDIEKTVFKHATSKISSVSDLEKIATLGFRGEALYSISSVSKLTLSSRSANAEIGTQAVFLENKLVEKKPVGMPRGTRIVVENLFFNLPARKKFLKSDVTEFKHILSRVINYALIYPEVSFKLVHNNRTILNFKSNDLESRVSEVLKIDLKNDFVKFSKNIDDWQAVVFVVKPDKVSEYPYFNYCFVNKRPVNSSLIFSALKTGLKTLFPESVKFSYLVYFNLPYNEYDVNIHPRKEEIKFLDNNKVFSFIQKTVSEDLLSKNLIYRQNIGNFSTKFRSSFADSANKDKSSFKNLSQSNLSKTNFKDFAVIESKFRRTLSNWSFKEDQLLFQDKLDQTLKYWQIFNLFILVEKDNQLIIIDQHAADERRIYEQIKSELSKTKSLSSVNLLIPLLIQLPKDLQTVCFEYQKELKQLGFKFEEFGFDKLKITAVPEFIQSKDIKKIFFELVSSCQNQNQPHSDRLERIIATIACRTAVKAGDRLTDQEIETLINQLEDETFFRFTCPHGRPTAIIFKKTDLEKMFKRRK